MATYNVSFANFICLFGNEKKMLDYAEEIVIPAFLDDSLHRSYGDDTEFFLYKTQLIKFDDAEIPSVGVIGHIVKDTVVRRTQIYDEGAGLIHDEAQLASAPSAFFILILNNHKLLYLPETPNAPDIRTFSSTISSFIKKKHKEFTDNIYESLRSRGEKVTKKSLFITHPIPKVTVVPLATKGSIQDFISKYRNLKYINFKLLRPNDELQGGETWESLRKLKEKVGAETTQVTHRNREGLDKDEATQQILDAAAAGNQKVTLSGLDNEGNILRGNNEHFKYSVDIGAMPDDDEIKAQNIYREFSDSVASGTVILDTLIEDVSEIIRRIIRHL